MREGRICRELEPFQPSSGGHGETGYSVVTLPNTLSLDFNDSDKINYNHEQFYGGRSQQFQYKAKAHTIRRELIMTKLRKSDHKKSNTFSMYIMFVDFLQAYLEC